jgi:hypothetical protein
MTEHRVPMLGGAWRRHGDPARSSDPRVRELVGALAGLEVAPPLRAEFRAELRAQLVAVTPRLVEEGEASVVPAARATTTAAQARGKRTANAERADAEPAKRFRFAKPLIAVACALTAFVLLLGGAVLLSQHALPGDALYGVKRASEDVEYSTTSGTVAKGKLKLDFAATRIGEVNDLVRAPTAMAGGTGAIADSGQINSSTASLVSDTLTSANNDVVAASFMLNGDAVRNHDAGSLDAITSWTPAQKKVMRQIVDRIPAGSLHDHAVRTLALLQQAQQRSTALRADLGCNCLSSNGDTLGPFPCSGPCSSTPTQGPGGTPGTKAPGPTSSRSPASTGTGHRAGGLPTTAPVSPGTGTGTVTNPTPTSGGSGHPTGPGGSILPTKTPLGAPSSPHFSLPTLPGIGGHSGTGSGQTGTKLPIRVTTSCVSASVAGVGIGVGTC